MSKETEKVFKEFHKFIEGRTDDNMSESEIQKLMDEFMKQYNSNIPGFVTAETASSSDDFLELAYEADSIKDALKYAKEALKIDPYNYDAESMVINLKAKDTSKLVRDYAKAVQRATKHMEEEGYFEEDCIGAFWGILETRPYMRLRGQYVQNLIQCGMIGQARKECVELLRLCEGDNMGMRYLLMHMHVYFEDEKAALTLHETFDSYDETQMLLPLSILYYKKGDYAKATKYLKRLNNANADLKKFLKMYPEDLYDEYYGFEVEGGYRPGTLEELMVELRENAFLFMAMDSYFEWAEQQVRKF